eukprot:TRINITY_DN7423_c1_g1_i1.p1 TRINITY_DN7423_c1_g1~~TRINITY_DN7423_c1_g1_i1.p1  ORF type:complete len:159 (-),score=39.93 TRINITY_DN7423_c1_g1_i1:266-742(-)
MSCPQQRSVGLSDAAEQRWRQHLDRASAGASSQASQQLTAPSSNGMGFAAAIPTQELLEDMMRGPNAPPLPKCFQKWWNAPFVPPEGEEWHVLEGFYVKMSRAELDALLAHAEESDSEDDDVDSLADTSVGTGSDCGDEDLDLPSDEEDPESKDELSA